MNTLFSAINTIQVYSQDLNPHDYNTNEKKMIFN